MKKILSTTLSLILILSLSSCRTKDETEAEASSEKNQNKEIVWWNLFDPCDTFAGQISEFESANAGYKVVCKKFSNPEEYEKILINEIAEGGGPDIFSIKNTSVREHMKKIVPAPAEVITPEEFRNTFFAVANNDLILEDEDALEQVYAIPLYIDTLALYYNKKIFEDNLPSTDKPGETWEEIKEQAYALTKSDNSIEKFSLAGIAMGRADNISRATEILSLIMIQEGTEMYDSRGNKSLFSAQQGTSQGTGKAFYPGTEALRLYTSFALTSYKNYSWNDLITSRTGDSQEVGAFVNNKVAMIFGYSWLYDEIDLQIQASRKNGKSGITLENVSIAPAPQINSPSESGVHDAFALYYPLAVSRNSENPDMAWKFISFMSSPESLQDYHEKTHKPSSRKDMVDEQSLEKLFGVFARQASYAKSVYTVDDVSFKNIMSESINSVARSRKNPEDAMRLAQKRVDCLLEKERDVTLDVDCEKLE